MKLGVGVVGAGVILAESKGIGAGRPAKNPRIGPYRVEQEAQRVPKPG